MAAMEAAKEVMTLLARSGHQRGVDGMRLSLSAHFFDTGATLQAMQLSSSALAGARLFALEAAPAVHLPALSAEVLALPETAAALQNIEALAFAAKALLGDGGDGEKVARLAEEMSAAFGALGDPVAEAAALSAQALAHTSCRHSSRDAARAAARAVKVARGLADKTVLMHALEALVAVSFAVRDPDEALRVGAELAAVSRELGAKSTEARAKFVVARASLGPGAPARAAEAAAEAAELFQALGDATGRATSLAVAYDVEVLLGRPASAAARAREILALVQGSKAEPLASVMLGSVATSSPDAVAACQQALTLFRASGERAGDAAALVALANAQLCQGAAPAQEEGLKSATAALALFQELKSAPGEAAAQTTVGAAHALLRQGEEAKRAIRSAIDIFGRLDDHVGSQIAKSLLQSAASVAKPPAEARVEFDDAACIAHVRIADGVSRPSLEAVIAALQARAAKCIVMHLDGKPSQADLDEAEDAAGESGTSVPRAYGAFLMGLRMIGLPIIASICGVVSGPMWSLVLASDYRVAATSAVFMCPVWGKPECMGALIGHNTATQLCMVNGPRDSLVMLENGIVHQLQRGIRETCKVAEEMARRVVSTPAMACRKQPMVLNHAVGEYALAAASGKVAVV